MEVETTREIAEQLPQKDSKDIVVYEVNEVYVYIPAELSAAGFELKIAGSVSIIDKHDEFYLQWMPVDITLQDVFSLYLACDQQNPPLMALFPISSIYSVQESDQRGRSLTFLLTDGEQLPALHFYDGGTAGLIRALQRYTNLVSDPSDPSLLVREDLLSPQNGVTADEIAESAIIPGVAKTLAKVFIRRGPCLVSGVVGLTKMVKQRLLDDKLALAYEDGELVEGLEETSHTQNGHSDQPHPSSPQRRRPVCDVEASLFADPRIITNTRGLLPPRLSLLPRGTPLTRKDWESLRDRQGRISAKNAKKIRAKVFYGGVSPELRREVWKYILGYFPFEVTDIERMELRDQKEKEYWRMKHQWQSISEIQEKRFSKWRDHKGLIGRDVIRADRDLPMFQDPDSPKLMQLEKILRTHVMYNVDLGYVQGMSDLLAPLLVVMDNEVDSFWCFAGLMDMVQHYFEETQASMKIRLKQLRALLKIYDPELYQFLDDKECKSLYCCFRWLLVNFKREFSYDEVMLIWEVIWTQYLSPDFSVFIALAIMLREREQLMSNTNDISEIVQHINGLAGTIPLTPVLELAEVLCRQLGSCSTLPEDLQTLVVRPLPERPN